MTSETRLSVQELFDIEVRMAHADECGPEPSVREMITRYYAQAFAWSKAEHLADELITALSRIAGEA